MDVPPLLDCVVCVGVDVPPVLCGVVVAGTTGVAAVPPDDVEGDVEDDVDGVAVVVVEVVAVAELGVVVEAAGVPPDGGAVSAGVSLGRL